MLVLVLLVLWVLWVLRGGGIRVSPEVGHFCCSRRLLSLPPQPVSLIVVVGGVLPRPGHLVLPVPDDGQSTKGLQLLRCLLLLLLLVD